MEELEHLVDVESGLAEAGQEWIASAEVEESVLRPEFAVVAGHCEAKRKVTVCEDQSSWNETGIFREVAFPERSHGDPVICSDSISPETC